jgi:hypothetical protein
VFRRAVELEFSVIIDKDMKDFFISYATEDAEWAEWIAWQLEDAGHTTVLQAWDFRPGCNFVLEMNKATEVSNRTIAVLSARYLEKLFTHSEWAAAFAKDPDGRARSIALRQKGEPRLGRGHDRKRRGKQARPPRNGVTHSGGSQRPRKRTSG